MEALSLLEGCQNIFEKSHETWKSYFSKWETLAGLEEDLSDDASVGKESPPAKKGKKKVVTVKKDVVRGKKNKNETAVEVIERSEGSSNENLPEETDSKQLEMHLRTIFMDILKANKNKWGVFAVLSQTFSQGDVTIKGPHTFLADRQVALPSNDVEQGGKNFLFKKVFSPNTRDGSLLGAGIRSEGVEPFEGSFSRVDVTRETFTRIGPRTRLFYVDNKRLSFPGDAFIASRVLDFKSLHEDETKLKPPAVDFREGRAPEISREIKKEYFSERSIPEMNIAREEKGFGRVCLHKRTNGVGLNMENSNFITPERNPSERKCSSENILHRKRRRPTKLFFDFWDSSDSEDERTETYATPRIGWRGKTQKNGPSQEVTAAESDESDNILDRVVKV